MLTALLCMGLMASSSNNAADIRMELVKQIKKEYKVTRKDAWIIADAALRNSKRYDVPVEIILANIAIESAYDKDAMSDVGAVGLMQVMPATAEYIAKIIKPGEYNLSDIRTNIRFGTFYLRLMHKKYNDWSFAVRAYNCGPGRTDKVIAGKMDYPDETKDYFVKISDRVLIMQMAWPYVVDHADKEVAAAFSPAHTDSDNVVATFDDPTKNQIITVFDFAGGDKPTITFVGVEQPAHDVMASQH